MTIRGWRSVAVRTAWAAGALLWALGAGAVTCPSLHEQWLRFVGRHSPEARDSVMVVGANAGLKRLNNEIFQGWTYASEHISNVLHYLFAYHLAAEVGGAGQGVTHAESPYAKHVEVRLGRAALGDRALRHRVDAARYKAVGECVDYLFGTDAAAVARVEGVLGEGAPAARRGEILLSGGKSHIERLPPAEMRRLQEALLSHLGGPQKVREFLEASYVSGIGSFAVDAQFATKLAGLDGYGRTVSFDFSAFATALTGVGEQHSRLAWLFEGGGPEATTAVFDMVRKFGARPSETWSPQFRELIRSRAGADPAAGERLARELHDYMRSLNVIDYLPAAWLRLDPAAHARFNAMAEPGYVIFADVMGLGARNLAEMHGRVPELLRLIGEADRIGGESAAGGAEAEAAGLAPLFEQLLTLRSNVLAPSDAHLKDVRARLERGLEELGLRPDEVALWASGDDIFIALARSADRLKPEEISRRLLLGGELGGVVRLGVMRGGGRPRISLEAARGELGSVADALKAIEALKLPYETYVELLTADGALRVRQADGAPLPPGDRGRVVGALAGWRLSD